MPKDYKKIKKLEPPSEDCNLYLVSKDTDQYYMYQIPKHDPFLQTFKIMSKFTSKNILQLFDEVKQEDTVFYVTEVPEPSLLKYQSQLEKKMFEVQQAFRVISQILTGLFEVHKQNYLYLNVIPDAIKYDKGVAKLADFTNAERYRKNRGKRNREEYCINDKFLPPECYKDEPIGFRGEYWMLAVTFYFMLNAEYPFVGQNIYESIVSKCNGGFDYRKQVENSKNKRVDIITHQLCTFFRHAFALNPDKRLSQKQLKQVESIRKYLSHENLSYIREEQMQESAIIQTKQTKSLIELQISRQIEIMTFTQKNAIFFFTETNDVLEEHHRLAFRYALLKLCIVKNNQISAILDREESVEYRKTKDYIQTKEIISMNKKIVDMQYKQICLEFQTNSPVIKDALKFLGPLYNKDKQPKSFFQIKKEYRLVTSKLFALKNADYKSKKQTKLIRKTLELLVRIVFFHLINRIFEEEEIKENLQLYYKWSNELSSIQRLNQWFEKQSSENLFSFIRKIYQKYLSL